MAVNVSGHSFHLHRAAVRARLLRSDHVRPGPGSITWKVNREVIVIAGWGRAVLLQLAHPAVAWPAFRAVQLLTIGSLPPSVRQAYGFEWRGRDTRAFARWTALLRTSVRLLPPPAREWPMARRHGSSSAPTEMLCDTQ